MLGCVMNDDELFDWIAMQRQTVAFQNGEALSEVARELNQALNVNAGDLTLTTLSSPLSSLLSYPPSDTASMPPEINFNTPPRIQHGYRSETPTNYDNTTPSGGEIESAISNRTPGPVNQQTTFNDDYVMGFDPPTPPMGGVGSFLASGITIADDERLITTDLEVDFISEISYDNHKGFSNHLHHGLYEVQGKMLTMGDLSVSNPPCLYSFSVANKP